MTTNKAMTFPAILRYTVLLFGASSDQYGLGTQFIGHCVQLASPYAKLLVWPAGKSGIAGLNLNWNAIIWSIEFIWRKCFIVLSACRLQPYKTTAKHVYGGTVPT
jgi:hypothetical protein